MSPLLVLLALVAVGVLGYFIGRRKVTPPSMANTTRKGLRTGTGSPAAEPASREVSTSPTGQAPAPTPATPSASTKQVEVQSPSPSPRPATAAESEPQPDPATPTQATTSPSSDTEPWWKRYPSPIAVKRTALYRSKEYGNSIHCSYSDLTTANTERFLTLLRDRGFELDDFSAVELHDRYEEFDSYSFHNFDEALRERRWEDVYGSWKIAGSYDGAKVLIDECHPGLSEGIEIKFAEADAPRIEPLLKAIERTFIPDLFVMDGSTVVSYRGTRDAVALPSQTPYVCHAIGEGVFRDHTELVYVKIPACVREIGNEAFKGCKNLESISLQRETKTVIYRGTRIKETLPVENPVSIGRSAFEGCSSLKSLRLHPGVKSLDSRAFFGCSSLKQVQLYESLASIGVQAFQRCDSLKTAGPEGSSETYDIQLGPMAQIPDNLFRYLNGLTRVVVPTGVKRLGACSLYSCDNLEEIVLPESLEVIANEAIGFCPKLHDLHIPSGARIEGGLLRGCDALANKDGFIIHDDVLYEYVGHTIHVRVPDGVTHIADRAFAYYPAPGVNHGDIVSVTIPSSVASIGASAFMDCRRLADVNMPDTVAVADNAFAGCRSLKKKSSQPEPKRSRNVTWSWEMEPLKLAIDNSNASSKDAKRVHSYPATYLGSSSKKQGKLVIAPTNFLFTATTDRQGWPSVKGALGSVTDLFSRDGNVLTIHATNGNYRFELQPNDLDDIEFIGLEREESVTHVAGFADSIANGCVRNSWPGVAHPFFERHATSSTNRANVFEFIGWTFLTDPLPWSTHDIRIEHSRHKLRVTAKQGAEEYVYYETPVAMRVQYDCEMIGFFDDSGCSESAGCTFEFVENPTDEMMRQAKSVSEVEGNETLCYLCNPFGMKGIFRVTRSK